MDLRGRLLCRPQHLAIAISLGCAAVILYATRRDPVLSPDSISYLSAAAHLRSGDGLTEFTGAPFTVFGPVFPLLLAVGGRNLFWARIVCAAAVAGCTWLMFIVLRRRVRPWAALIAALAFGLSEGVVHVGSTVWSEMPYMLIALGAFAVLSIEPLTNRRAALGGLLCALGFLTRYAGVGLIITGVVIVVATGITRESTPRMVLRTVGIHLGVAAAVCAAWLSRNLIATGEAMGPRFSGGSRDSLYVLLRRATTAVGVLIFGDQHSDSFANWSGLVVLILLMLAAFVALASRPTRVLDIGMTVFAITCVVLPVMARRVTASDIEFRVLSPLLIPVVYFAAVTLDRIRVKSVGVAVCVALVCWSIFEGVAMAERVPEIVLIGAGSRTQFSRELFDLIDTLPADANVLTNSPQRVWWQSHREPTLFAFTRPRAGNSNYPLSPSDTLRYACLAHTYLAWFDGLANAGDGPADRRPDLAAIIDLTLTNQVTGGAMYALSAHDPAQCPRS